MQLGFVIDHQKCIGCHACTVACKSENDVPLGKFRTWVKYVESGTFPEVKRSFAVLRCNQCTDAPCVTICPVGALEKRPDGIVDIDPARCIGCKACMQGCPYDALYLNESTGLAEKCHFCAHRTEQGLAPACAVVCPTEAIIPGDFHDPGSTVSRLRREHPLQGRKLEAGTGPNVLYRDVEPAGIDPRETSGAGGYLWADRRPGLRAQAERGEETRARTTYAVDQPVYWGARITGYLFTKSLAAGLFLIFALLMFLGSPGPAPPAAERLTLGALLALAATAGLLTADLRRPERFLTILVRPNWDSWLTRGSFLIVAYGALLTAVVMARFLQAPRPLLLGLVLPTAVLSALVAGYTGWLFGQARGRVLWMQRGLWVRFILQAVLAGSALALFAAPGFRFAIGDLAVIRVVLIASLLVNGLAVLTAGRLAPRGREAEYDRAHRLLTRGFLARPHRAGLILGTLLPLILLLGTGAGPAWGLAGLLALAGLWIEESLLIRAGQALTIS